MVVNYFKKKYKHRYPNFVASARNHSNKWMAERWDLSKRELGSLDRLRVVLDLPRSKKVFDSERAYFARRDMEKVYGKNIMPAVIQSMKKKTDIEISKMYKPLDGKIYKNKYRYWRSDLGLPMSREIKANRRKERNRKKADNVYDTEYKKLLRIAQIVCLIRKGVSSQEIAELFGLKEGFAWRYVTYARVALGPDIVPFQRKNKKRVYKTNFKFLTKNREELMGLVLEISKKSVKEIIEDIGNKNFKRIVDKKSRYWVPNVDSKGLSKVRIKIEVKETKFQFGKQYFLIAPTDGTGKFWVAEESLEAYDD